MHRACGVATGVRRRAPLRCTAHGSHDHGHSHSGSSSCSCDSPSGEEDEAAATLGHSHGPSADPNNPVHRVLKVGGWVNGWLDG